MTEFDDGKVVAALLLAIDLLIRAGAISDARKILAELRRNSPVGSLDLIKGVAERLFALGEQKSALELYAFLAARHPTDDELHVRHFEIGMEVSVERIKQVELVISIEKFLKFRRVSSRHLLRLSLILQRLMEFGPAMRLALTAKRRGDANTEAGLYLARLHIWNRSLGKARKVLASIYPDPSHDQRTLRALGDLAAQAGDPRLAVKYGRRLYGADRNNLDTIAYFARHLAAETITEVEALDLVRDTVERRHDQFQIRHFNSFTRLLSSLGDHELAASLLQKAHDRFPDSDEIKALGRDITYFDRLTGRQ